MGVSLAARGGSTKGGVELMVRPECLGLPIASLHIGLMMLFIPFPFSHLFSNGPVGRHTFPHTEVSEPRYHGKTGIRITDS